MQHSIQRRAPSLAGFAWCQSDLVSSTNLWNPHHRWWHVSLYRVQTGQVKQHTLVLFPNFLEFMCDVAVNPKCNALTINRSQVRLPAVPLSCNDPGQVVHTRVPLFTKQYKLVPANRWWWSMAQLAMRHRLSGISTYGLNGLGNGDEHPV